MQASGAISHDCETKLFFAFESVFFYSFDVPWMGERWVCSWVLGGGSVLPAGQQAEGASVFRPNTGTVFLSSVLDGVVGSEGLFHFLML